MNGSRAPESYEAATTAGALVLLDDWSTVRVTGADRANFLHNMCTSNIRGLTVGSCCETFFTDVRGKIIAHAFVFATSSELLIALAPHKATKLASHLERYIIREDVQLAHSTGDVSWSIALGPGRQEVVDRLRAALPDFATSLGVAPCQGFWPGGDWIAVGASDPMTWLLHLETSAALVFDAEFDVIRIESGWPLFGVDFDETNLPQEVGRDAEAINFRKGCYLGQETVARIDALGHVNRRVATVRIDGETAPAIGTELLADGQSVGHVTSACWSPQLGVPLALAMVRRGHNDPGSQLVCSGAAAEVIATPAVAPQVDR